MPRSKREGRDPSNSSESEVEVLYDKEKDRRARRKGQSPRREASKRRLTKETPGTLSLHPRFVIGNESTKFEAANNCR